MKTRLVQVRRSASHFFLVLTSFVVMTSSAFFGEKSPDLPSLCGSLEAEFKGLWCHRVSESNFVELGISWPKVELVRVGTHSKQPLIIAHPAQNNPSNQKNISEGSFDFGIDAVSFESTSPIEGTTIKGLWFPSDTGPVQQVIGDAELEFIRDQDGSSFSVSVTGLALIHENHCENFLQNFPTCSFNQDAWSFPDHLFYLHDVDYDGIDELVYEYYWGRGTSLTAFNFLNSEEEFTLGAHPISIRYAGNIIKKDPDSKTVTVGWGNAQKHKSETWQSINGNFELVEKTYRRIICCTESSDLAERLSDEARSLVTLKMER